MPPTIVLVHVPPLILEAAAVRAAA
jgi:hypothetical protein